MVIRSEGAVEYVMVGVSRRPTQAIWRGKEIEPVRRLLKKRLTLSPVLQSFQEEVQDSRINLFKELERKERGAGTENTSPSYTACFA
ncbi:hypothetical protein TNCV_3225611 [Trichonephila clavipes]|nr:hypothetical protein TNCV_3225611 [Trichonephila clavipes]